MDPSGNEEESLRSVEPFDKPETEHVKTSVSFF
jgi:hypothetical protein